MSMRMRWSLIFGIKKNCNNLTAHERAGSNAQCRLERKSLQTLRNKTPIPLDSQFLAAREHSLAPERANQPTPAITKQTQTQRRH